MKMASRRMAGRARARVAVALRAGAGRPVRGGGGLAKRAHVIAYVSHPVHSIRDSPYRTRRGRGLRMTWPPAPTACLGREGAEHAELRRHEVREDPVRELHPVRLRARRHLRAQRR